MTTEGKETKRAKNDICTSLCSHVMNGCRLSWKKAHDSADTPPQGQVSTTEDVQERERKKKKRKEKKEESNYGVIRPRLSW